MLQPTTLHFFCGKAASGKSTHAARLADAPHTVLLSEDHWLHALYGDQMTSLKDYVHFTQKLRRALTPHVLDLLQSGFSVVLDFSANTVESRKWMRRLIDQSGVAHQLHLFDLSDETCLMRLQARNASGAHPFTLSDAQFAQLSQHFAPPQADEGFNILRHSRS